MKSFLYEAFLTMSYRQCPRNEFQFYPKKFISSDLKLSKYSLFRLKDGLSCKQALKWARHITYFYNPLNANVQYTQHDTVVTSDSCNSGHSQNYEKTFDIFAQELEISYKMVYKTL